MAINASSVPSLTLPQTGLSNPLLTISSNNELLKLINKNGEVVLIIYQSGEIFYNFEDDLKKVDCPEDIVRAFIHTIFQFTGENDYEGYLIDKIISNTYISDNTLKKVDKAIRKRKLQNLKKL